MTPRASVQPSPSGPKVREWGKTQGAAETCGSAPLGHDPQQGSSKPVGFVKAEGRERDDERQLPGKAAKTDEELEQERKEARRRECGTKEIRSEMYAVHWICVETCCT
jgi:RNA-binding protein 25